ncbi:MAG: hypothetical protein IJ011_07320 [Clostridia bacterium]|nr:hypothetical protein [Clostridia bacterium]
MKKKILSLALTLAMLLSALSVMGTTVFATEAEITTISSYEDLVSFVNSLATYDYSGKTVTLTSDVKVNDGWVANDGKVAATAAPTGDDAKVLDTTVATNAFKGTLDGNGKTVSGLYINGSAFIPTVSDATIKNITFDNCYTNNSIASGYTAIVAGALSIAKTATFTNVVVSNSKVVNGATNGSVGTMLAAALSDSTATNLTDCEFTNCRSEENMVVSGAKTSLVGGLVGSFGRGSGTFTDCVNTSTIYAIPGNSTLVNAGYKVGGILGSAGGNASTCTVSFIECVNTGEITGFSHVGGMVGDGTPAFVVSKCVNTGSITAGDTTLSNDKSTSDCNAAGFIGRYNASVLGQKCTISESINTGDINAVSASGVKRGVAGGFIGSCNNDKSDVAIVDCVNTGKVKGSNRGGGAVGFYHAGLLTSTFERVIITQTTEGKDTACKGSIIGYWAATTVADGKAINLTDVYYGGADGAYAFGRWYSGGGALGTYGSINVTYTYPAYTKNFVGGVDNTDSDYKAAYSIPFAEGGGYISDFSTVYGEKGAEKFAALALGEKWVLTDTVPMPAAAHKLLENTLAESDVINYIGFQKKLGTDTLQVRLVAELASTEYRNTGFEIVVVEKLATYATANGVTTITVAQPTIGAAAVETDQNSTTVYTSLKAFGEDGTELAPVTASEGKYLSAITVTNIPTAGTFTFIIKPYVTLLDGSGVEYGASYAVVVVDGAVSYGYAM